MKLPLLDKALLLGDDKGPFLFTAYEGGKLFLETAGYKAAVAGAAARKDLLRKEEQRQKDEARFAAARRAQEAEREALRLKLEAEREALRRRDEAEAANPILKQVRLTEESKRAMETQNEILRSQLKDLGNKVENVDLTLRRQGEVHAGEVADAKTAAQRAAAVKGGVEVIKFAANNGCGVQ